MENCDDFQKQFPPFHLEDKVVLEAGSNDRLQYYLNIVGERRSQRIHVINSS